MLEITVIDGQIQLQPCGLYAHTCAILNAHHVAPLSWWNAAGVPVQTPFAMICPTCHMNTHAAIDGIIEGRDVSLLPPRCVKLAQQAFTLATTYGLTPGLTL